MSEAEVIRSDEKVFPLLYTKKVLPLEKTKKLQETVKGLMQDNEDLITNEELMLGKISDKHKEFVKRLEAHLKNFEQSGVQKVQLASDMMLPGPSQREESSNEVDNKDDHRIRLEKWYDTMLAYVSLQRDGVNEIISDWFSEMDKIASEGEPDPLGTEDTGLVCEDVKKSEKFWINIIWYIIVFILISIPMLFGAEDVNRCMDDGFFKCFMRNMIKISAFLQDHYLRFHNITLDYPSNSLMKSSTDKVA